MRYASVITFVLLIVCSCGIAGTSPGQQAVAGKDITHILHKSTKGVSDARLQKKVSFTQKDVTLYDAIERLSADTDVRILAGRDGRDWQVRDIPVTVCARDMPLGDVLRALALCSYCMLSHEEKDDADDVDNGTYRIWRDKRRRDIIDDYMSQLESIDSRRAARALEAGSLFDQIPDEKISLSDGWAPVYKGLSRLLAGLGTDARTALNDGKPIRLDMTSATPGIQSQLMVLYQADWDAHKMEDVDAYASLPNQGDWSKALFVMYRDQGDIRVWVRNPLGEAHPYRMSVAADQVSSSLGDSRLARPSSPEVPVFDSPGFKFRCILPGQSFSLDDPVNSFLDTRCRLVLKENSKATVSYSDVYEALSESTGYSFFCDDFASYRVGSNAKSLLDKEYTLREIIHMLSQDRLANIGYWYVDQNAKLIIIKSREWPKLHGYLVPQDYVLNIRRKLGNEGLDLEDILNIAAMVGKESNHWIYENRHLDARRIPRLQEPYLWLFFQGLSPKVKTSARSEHGLRLSSLDRDVAMDVLSGFAVRRWNAQMRSWKDLDFSRLDTVQSMLQHPELQDDVFLRLSEEDILLARDTLSPTTETKTSVRKKLYRLILEVVKPDGARIELDAQTIRGLPVLSKEREQELPAHERD